MATQNITFRIDQLNFSLVVGDIIYYTYNTSRTGDFEHANLSNTRRLGKVVEIREVFTSAIGAGRFAITVQYDDDITTPPQGRVFISFAKDKRVNTSSLLGYYASAKFVNNSTNKVELFSIGSEVTESSK
tara:strand:- start:1467 stop:1856 length:390 start_codon:yes stop_codon:yes gene_type:complete